ncbi:MAG: AAA family ATPase [Gammaproteobacteria bacterium]|nr:AAA family ATPase [Gammaproteobacteria bacterium]
MPDPGHPQPIDHRIPGALLRPAAFPHPADDLQLIETHISWVILAGDYAYKIKKPVNLGFLDFSTLANRRHYCTEELRLNRRLAASYYLELSPITASPEGPVVDGNGDIIEYAVRMRRLPAHALLKDRLSTQPVPATLLDKLADQIARFHQQVAVATSDTLYGDPDRVAAPVLDNVTTLRRLLTTEQSVMLLDRLEGWLRSQLTVLQPLLAQRKQQGFIRECHGDLHLGNIAVVDHDIVIFDCLEFNAELRWTDTFNELAFLVMDLHAAKQWPAAQQLLNRYLEHTGDYPGLRLLDFYCCYRAMVRAKVCALQASQHAAPSEQRRDLLDQAQRYLMLACHYQRPRTPALILTHGYSGSGKSTITGRLLQQLGAIRIRSDIERRRPPHTPAVSAVNQGNYSPQARATVYHRLLALSEHITRAGFPVIVDATFLQAWQRQLFVELGRSCKLPLLILDCQAPDTVLRRWITQRQALRQDPSEATLEVLAMQQRTAQPLTTDEQACAIVVDTTTDVDIAQLAGNIIRRLRLDLPADW